MDFFNSKPPTGASATSTYDSPETPFGRAISERFSANATSSLLTTKFTPSVPLQTPMAPSIGQLHRSTSKPPSLPSIPAGSLSGASALSMSISKRSNTPAAVNAAFTPFLPAEVIPLLSLENVLFIDLRSLTYYQASHLRNAISVAIPSTLLKRPNYPLEQMAAMINDKASRELFEKWRDADKIIAYDADSIQLMEATVLVGLLRKFLLAGFKGTLGYIKGGFNVLASQFPSVLESATIVDDRGDTSEEDSETILRTRKLSMSAFQQSSTTVVGQRTPKGHEDSSSTLAANPFYDNIRQNVELSQGVDRDTRISLDLPPLVVARRNELPFKWLRDIVDRTQEDDVGEALAMQFYRIELGEQRRLQGVMDHHTRESRGGNNALEFPYSITAGIERGDKNRYRNIWPFEHARVRLRRLNSKDGSDYVNASYVQSLVSSRRYIATQGPLDSTYDDFWSICWEQNVPVIVMLTREIESSLVKCGKYWNDGQYGDITLKLLQQDGLDDVDKTKPGGFFQTTPKADSADTIIERVFQLTNKAQPNAPAKRIVHFQYLGWPDLDVPKSPVGLLSLIKRVNLVTNGHPSGGSRGPGPILLHCSAGVGRTGGFILVDSILAGIRHEMQRKGTFPSQGILDDTSESDEMDVDADDDLDAEFDEEVDVRESVFSRRKGLRSGSNTSFSPTSSSFGGPSQSGSDGAPMHNASTSSLASTNASTSVRSSRGFEGPGTAVSSSNGESSRATTTMTPAAPKPQRLSHVIAEKLMRESKAPLHTPAEITEWSMKLPNQTVPAPNFRVGREGENVIVPTKDSPPEDKLMGANYKLPRKLDSMRGSPPFPSDFNEPVREVLEDMREQRMSLCQSLRQYVFAHRAIIEGALELVDEAKEQRLASQSRSQPQSRPQSKPQSRTQSISHSHSHSRSYSGSQAQSIPQPINFTHSHSLSRDSEKTSDEMTGAHTGAGFLAWSSTSSLSSTSGLPPLSSSPSRLKAGRLSSSEDKTPRGFPPGSSSNTNPLSAAAAMASSPPPMPKAMTGKRSASPETAKLDVANLKIGKSPSLKKRQRSEDRDRHREKRADVQAEDLARTSLKPSTQSSTSDFGISSFSGSSASFAASATGLSGSAGKTGNTQPSYLGRSGQSSQPSQPRH